jgi:hypothetical protein
MIKAHEGPRAFMRKARGHVHSLTTPYLEGWPPFRVAPRSVHEGGDGTPPHSTTVMWGARGRRYWRTTQVIRIVLVDVESYS